MAVYEPKMVDGLELEKATGHIVLTVIDDLNWVDEDAHIANLEEKLNSYLAFIESGEVFARLREKEGRPVSEQSPIKIVVRARHPVSSLGQQFYDYAKNTFADAKVGLFFRLTPA